VELSQESAAGLPTDTVTQPALKQGSEDGDHEAHDEDDDEDHVEDDEHDAELDEAEGEEEEEGAPAGEDEISPVPGAADEQNTEALDAGGSQELTEAERERLELLAEEEMRKKQSAGQKRMQEFLDKIKESTRRHATHPRRKPKHFFMPMMFSDDIYFDPFETVNHELELRTPDETAELTEEQLVADYDDSGAPTKYVDPFADVNVKLGEFRKQEEMKRKALFATTLQEVPAKDWIQVLRTYTVDWDSFFASQNAMVELSAAVRESDKEIEEYFRNNDPLKKITDNLSVGPRSPAASRAGSHVSLTSTGYLSGTVTPVEGATPAVTFLPYGKILEHQRVRQGDYKYFRLEQFKQTAMLTIEVQCLSGLVDVYLAYQKLPSQSMHDRHVACTKENKGVVRLAFRPMKSGTFFIAVRSHETDAKFNIWTYSSSGAAEQSPIIARVSSIIRKFEILATVDEEKLQELYPKYEREALKQVHEEEAARARAEAEARLRGPAVPHADVVDDEASLNELYDIENVNSFILRVSKYTLMGEEAAALYGGGELERDFEEDDEGAVEYGQEIEDLFMPMHSPAASAKDLHDLPGQGPQDQESPRQSGLELPPIHRGHSMPALRHERSDITLDSAFADLEAQGSFRLPEIKGADGSSGFNTKRSVPRSRSSINVAREYAALDRALSKAMHNKPEKKLRVENPLLHQTLKPVKYQLRGNYPI
jgi:hypothetical protein